MIRLKHFPKLVMPISKIVALSAEILILFSRLIYAVDSSCMIAYNDGGAPAVLQSLECTTAIQWVESFKKSTKDCDFASLQGHRQYQEDRVTCIHNIKLPLIGKGTKSDAKVDLLAIFDGHGGSEASEMAKQYLLGFFLVHVIANAIKNASNLENHNDLLNVVQGSRGHLIEIDDNSIHEIFKYSLLGAIRDIDRKFSLEAVENRYSSGSTASVALLLNNEELIVANVGDSKVILCAGSAEELTNDHHPDRDDERARIEQAGGYVLDWDVPRVNGILAVSRAIGDVSLKRYGVIAEPELVGWLNITAKDRYLAVVSDGVFESLTPENVCQLVDDADVEENARAYDRIPFLPSFSMAYRVVKTGLQKGSTDNLSAIVVPLALATDEVLVHKDEL